MAGGARARGGHAGTAGGFVLAEVLVAAAILAVGLLGLGALEVAAAGAAEAARTRRVAAALVRNALETGSDPAGTWSYDRDGGPAGPGAGAVTVTVTRLSPVGAAGRYRVEASWPGRVAGRQRLAVTRLEAP